MLLVFASRFAVVLTALVWLDISFAKVSVERVLAFGKLPPEAPLEFPSDSKLIREQWPQEGEIAFQDVSVRYRPTLPLALNKVCFHIPRGVRVGVVG